MLKISGLQQPKTIQICILTNRIVAEDRGMKYQIWYLTNRAGTHHRGMQTKACKFATRPTQSTQHLGGMNAATHIPTPQAPLTCAIVSANPLAREMQRYPTQANGNTPYAPGRAFVEGATAKLSDSCNRESSSLTGFTRPSGISLTCSLRAMGGWGQCIPAGSSYPRTRQGASMLTNPPKGQTHVEHEDGTISFPSRGNIRRTEFIYEPLPNQPGWYHVPEFEDERYQVVAGPCKVCGHLREARFAYDGPEGELICPACALHITEQLVQQHTGYSLREITEQSLGGRKIIPSSIKQMVYQRDEGRCRYCGSTKDLALDHVYPHSLGGSDTYDNLVLACRSCNSKKHDKTPEQAGMTLLPVGGVK